MSIAEKTTRPSPFKKRVGMNIDNGSLDKKTNEKNKQSITQQTFGHVKKIVNKLCSALTPKEFPVIR